MKKVKIQRSANAEIRQAIKYYNGKKSGLGDEFFAELERSLKLIQQHPKAWPLESQNTRCHFMNRFPYSILYWIDEDSIFIVAVMHQRRDPDYWKDRLKK